MRVLFKDVFPSFLNSDKDCFQVRLNKSEGKSCAVPQGQKEVFLIIAPHPPQLKSAFLTYLQFLLTNVESASARSAGGTLY